MMNREDAIILSDSIDANLARRTIFKVSIVECHCRSRTLPCIEMPNSCELPVLAPQAQVSGRGSLPHMPY
jgi:hypothetical protein